MTKTLIFTLLLPIALKAETRLVLEAIEKQINSSLEDKIQLGIEKEDLNSQIAELKTKMGERRKVILKRLRAINSLKKFSWSELIFSKDLNETEKKLKILSNLNKYDYQLFKDYSTTSKLLDIAQKNLQETEQLILENLNTLQTQQLQFHELESQRISQLQKSNGLSLLTDKGSLSRPLDGVVASEFGAIRDRNEQFYLINRGELYTTKPDLAVKAVGPGKVIFRDAIARWRETLIVQHSDNYYSVYSGVKNPRKSVGDRVEKDEMLGLTAENEFYFELRHFLNPINPQPWYKE